ncbi:hypothetical protein GCM10020216_081130 [Nonomuraea helvata]
MDFEIREGRERSRGRRALSRERAAYLRLVQQGLSNKEACRIVGINLRTGRRRRNGRNPTGKHVGALPITSAAPSDVRGRYLNDRVREKASIREIARELGRAPSTISREIRRNRHPTNGQYRPHAAQARADARRPRPKPSKLGQKPELRAYIQEHLHLHQRWSPEQIVQSLRKTFPERAEMHVCHETIYQALYVQGRGELRRELTRALCTGRAMRKPRRQAQQRQPRYSTPMVMISERPAEADDRAVPGHWEGDCEHHRQERHLGDRHLDFCDPASPWQRGSNENTNGLLRQYFPKGTDLSVHTRHQLAAVAAELMTACL